MSNWCTESHIILLEQGGETDMKTSTAEKNNYICPKCGGRVKKDLKGRGFVMHRDYGNPRYCDFERGMKDKNPLPKSL